MNPRIKGLIAGNPLILYIIEALLVMGVAVLVQPTGDDWFFLRYFENASDWSISGYCWLYDNHLLIRDYWRPLEDMVLFGETDYPNLFPTLQHVMIVALSFGAGYILYLLGIKAGASPRSMAWTIIVGMPCATNMGALLSPDSWTQVMAAFFGVLSVWFYVSRLKLRYVWWVLSGIVACLSKESGFIFLMAGPLCRFIIDYRRSGVVSPFVKALVKGAIAAMMIMGVYLSVYFYMKHLQSLEGIAPSGVSSLVESAESVAESESLFESRQSHSLTPVTFVKNVAILYGLGIYPVAVQGFYYHCYWIVALTLIVGWGGVLLTCRMWRSASRRRRMVALMLFGVAIAVSMPSLITRAGEISPFNSNLFIICAIGVLAEDYRFKCVDWVCIWSFVIATLIADGYKYSLVWEGGWSARHMAQAIVEQSPDCPERVLWVGVDEGSQDKAGGAFTKSPYRGFDKGNAVIREYGYKYPRTLHKILVPDGNNADGKVDSIVAANRSGYDCIWVTCGSSVKVYK